MLGSLSLLPFAGLYDLSNFDFLQRPGTGQRCPLQVSWGGSGCLQVGPGAGSQQQRCPPGPASAPGASQSRHGGGRRQDASWLRWRQVLTSALGPAQPCSERKSSFYRTWGRGAGELESGSCGLQGNQVGA